MLREGLERAITDEVEWLKVERSKSYREALKDLDHVAVCLVGHLYPIPVKVGSNAVRYPVYVRTSRTPMDCAEDFDRAHPVHPVKTLEYVWTESDRHARRLKDALDRSILGTDPDMIRLRGAWRDMPDWQMQWRLHLEVAVRDLAERGETVGFFSEDQHRWRVRAHAAARARGKR